MVAYKGFVQTEFGGAQSRDQNFTGQKWEKKLTSFNRFISVITNIYQKWFVMFEHTINRLFFGYFTPT